jgi:dGTPase
MDWADDITYSVHDTDDFYRAGRIPLHSLAEGRSRTAERDRFLKNVFHRRHKTRISLNTKRT